MARRGLSHGRRGPQLGRCFHRRRGRSRLALLLAASCALTAACGGERPPLVVGSKNFTEQSILGELVAGWIERTTTIPVRRRLHLGGTFIAHQALIGGQIDLYVEYTGTALTAILEHPPVADRDSVRRAVAAEYDRRWSLQWTPPLGFENTFAILVRRSTADSLGLRTISDAAPHAPGWRPGFGYEFTEREDGLRGLARTYGLRFGRDPRLMDLGLLYRALASEQVDLVAGNSTDGQIAALNLIMLEDDLHYFPPYEAAPVVRKDALEAYPQLGPALRELAGRIDTREMRALNRAVDVDGRDFREVVRDWIDSELGRTSAGYPTRSGRTSAGQTGVLWAALGLVCS
jgi:osmoprotectant transport system substrate-binding protein